MLLDDPDPRARLRREAGRVTDRLRDLDLARLARDEGRGSPADLARACAQRLADLAADAQRRARRPLPALAVHAAADQVAVTAGDVLLEGDDGAVLAAVAALRDLRRAL